MKATNCKLQRKKLNNDGQPSVLTTPKHKIDERFLNEIEHINTTDNKYLDTTSM